jgi:amino acid adenylation domain-containing protein
LVRFEEMAQRFAARPAVDDGDICWTYARLNDYANVTGAWLAQLVEPGARVGLLLGHDAPMVAGLLGVLKAGCTYVPLDPESPPARIRAIIDEADLAAVVTDGMHRTLLHAAVNGSVAVVEVPEDAACGAPAPDCSKYLPDDLAYILFTSGSTGTPKGVMQTHRNVLHHARTYINALHINESDRLSLFSTYGFDASVMDIFGALLSGACLCPVDMRAQQHPGELLDRIGLNEDADGRSTAVTVLHTTPTVFRFLMRHKVCRHELTGIRLVVLGGEEARAADFALFKRHFAPPTLFVNGLGPSESTLAAQFFADHSTRLPGQVVPIGYAVADTVLELLNDDGSPAGVQGELAVCSPYVSLGYWRQPDLTTEKFVAAATSQQPGRIQYRTGDRARRLPDGQLVYLGRADGQLKLRGHRIEPGEIEAQLAGLRGVDRCTVMLRSDAADGRQSEARLVAYIVKQDGADDADVGVGIVRTKLKALLPEYMVPQALVLVDDLPLLPNGKVDRKRLPAPDWTRAESASFVKPRTATEQQLAGIWSEILGVSRVGVHDDFFELGGHSLLAAQLVARVTESMQIGLPLRRLFDAPTIAGLAEHVDALQWALQNQPEPRPRS